MRPASYFPGFNDLTRNGAAQERFHREAAGVAQAQFGKKVFVRAVVEVSNFCRQNCSYCGMRRENRELERFRADHEQLAEMILEHRPRSVTDLNIQAGEDPKAVREVVVPLIRALKRETNLGVSVCLGSLANDLYDEMQAAGASIYILKFESGDRELYEKMESPGTFDERLARIRYLASRGWSVSSGFIAGLPEQTPAQMLASFRVANELPLDGCSVSPFIPGDETPLAASGSADINVTLNSMAALRLMRPDWVIPAVSALNLAEPGSGYRRGLRTGANLVTINMTPAGMRDDYLLYKRERFIMTEEVILRAIEAEGLEPSEVGLAQYYAARRSQRAQLAVA
jgi:biotin synthase